MIPELKRKVSVLLAMHKCEGCGRCCRKERVTVSPEDVRRNRKLSGAIESRVPFGYAVLRLPCPFISELNRCTCYSIRPLPCKRYPFFEKYPGYISVSRCPYGDKIIKDVLEFCELNGVATEDSEAKENIMEMDQAYRDMGIGQEEAQLCLSIPAPVFDGFFEWLMGGKR